MAAIKGSGARFPLLHLMEPPLGRVNSVTVHLHLMAIAVSNVTPPPATTTGLQGLLVENASAQIIKMSWVSSQSVTSMARSSKQPTAHTYSDASCALPKWRLAAILAPSASTPK